MKLNTTVKAGGNPYNHNQTLKVRTGVKAGALNAYLRLTGETQGYIRK